MTRLAAVALAAALATAGCVGDVDLGAWRLDAHLTPDTAPPPPPAPCVVADPFAVDFGLVERGAEADALVTLTNTCAAPVAWLGLKLAGDPGFTVDAAGASYRPSTALASAGARWPSPLTLAPGAAATLRVRYTATTPELVRAHAILLLDDPGQPTGLALRLEAGGQAPCLAIFPKSLDFGGKVVGETARRPLELRACGAEPLRLDKLALDAPADLALEPPPGLTLPHLLAPGERLTLTLAFTPASPSPGWPDAPPAWTVGRLEAIANDFDRLHAVDVRGFGVTEACPEARISVDGPPDAAPVGATITLDAAASVAVTGPLTAFAWTVDAPFAASPFAPSAAAEAVTYRLAVAGEHRFTLDVVDASGRHACVPATHTVTATSAAALRVELLWHTPNDPDPHDAGFERGADLDLHLTHPFAVGPDLDGDGHGDAFFDLPYDVFFDNPEPLWAAPTAAAPALREDDQDGTGPEVIEVPALDAALELGVGVHAWADNGFGPSYATVRVLAGDALVYQSDPVLLLEDELWVVGRLAWPGPTLLPATGRDGAPRVLSAIRAASGRDKD